MHALTRCFGLVIGGVIGFAWLSPALYAEEQRAFSPAEVEYFEKHIRPVLIENCQKCHGPKQQKGGLRLDSRTAILKGGETGPAIVPGEPDESELIAAVNYDPAGYQMPPSGKLAAEQIARLTEWVKMGAPWPAAAGEAGTVGASDEFNIVERAKHWAFQPVEKPAVPAVEQIDWPRSPIDRFILSKLEAAGLTPAPEADRRTLIRRVTYDLTGLPPRPEDIAAFLQDESPDAYEKVVERLLASPHYGERWARHWLDLVRYAETAGHEFDYEIRMAWPYRDYVIRAFNDDLPYNQFVIEHIAGDLLEEPRLNRVEEINESIIGTAFYWFGQGKHSPVDIRAEQCDTVENQIDVLGKTFLGLTIACARCHDHKFDPISIRDFYALAGSLQSSRMQEAYIDLPEQTEAVVEQLNELKSDARELLTAGTTAHASFSRRPSGRAPNDHPAPHEPIVFEDFETDSYDDWFVTGHAFGTQPSRGGELLLQDNPDRPIQAIVSPGMAHSGLISDKLHGALRSQTFTIDKRFIHYRMHRTAGESIGRRDGIKNGQVHLVVDGFQFIKNPIYGELSIQVAEKDEPVWHRQDLEKWIGHKAYIEIVDDGDGWIAVDRIVFSDAPAPPAVSDPGSKQTSTPAADAPGSPGKVDGDDKVRRRQVAELLVRYRQLETQIPTPRIALATVDGTGQDERLLIRGNHKKPGEPVARRFLEVFDDERYPPPQEGSGRLQLARQMIDPSNPLLARVLVNRLWQHHFGTGIVSSVDNFGKLGQPPTHPELLDYLASEFVAGGWSIKQMHRLMVLSSTYRMSSRSDSHDPSAAIASRTATDGLNNRASTADIDPGNRLLHRMPVRRLEGEAIRDALLSLSGRLDRRLYGPPVMPHLTPFMEGRGRPGKSGPLDGDGRRSVYINVRRNFLTPMFLAFDYPTPLSTMGQRSTSNVPAQALTMMNNDFVIQQAGLWARRVLQEPHATHRDRIVRLYDMAYGRPATDAEQAAALEFLTEQGALYSGTDDPRTWADLCHVLVNVKEFIFVN
jgi:hypothetical protein